MAKMKNKLETVKNALVTLQEGIELFHMFEKIANNKPSQEQMRLFLATRDSMIQRFEYCTDLFWKVLKIYLEDIEKVELPINSPRGIIRETVKVRTISEDEGFACMSMIKRRNETSHIYHENLAEDIAQEVPKFYQLMANIVNSIQKKMF